MAGSSDFLNKRINNDLLNRSIQTFFLIILSNYVAGQILPAPDASLNYTQIMFEHERVRGASEYLIEVKQTDENDSSFRLPAYSQRDSSTASMISNFEFGKKYQWRFTGLNNGQILGWHGPYNFTITTNIHINKGFYRARVVHNDSVANAGGLIVMDMSHSIVDRNGNFVWFLPPDISEETGGASSPSNNDFTIDDMRLSPFGTVTYISNERAEERDLSGHLLWRAPVEGSSNDSAHTGRKHRYHHCFQRLQSGNYMVLDRDSILVRIDTGYVFMEDENICEFDKNKNLIWSWSSEHYLDSIEIKKIVQSKADSGMLDPTPGGHLNSFYADEANGYIYAGFRNINRIIKIDKKTGNVVGEWGTGMKNGDGFFAKQHGLYLLSDGSVVVFSNGERNSPSGDKADLYSSVVNFSQAADNQNSRVIQKFDCILDSVKYQSRRGGNVDELKNGNLLVCTGAVGRIFEIDRNKDMVWSAVIERGLKKGTIWRPYALNRAHYTSSLYPNYFTTQCKTDTIRENDKVCKLKIFNDGTEADSYIISILDPSHSTYKTPVITSLVSAHTSVDIEIPAEGLAAKTKKIKVRVQSKTNTDRTRYVVIHTIAR